MSAEAVDLDHVGVSVKSLDAGRDAYQRLGFQLTARSMHRGSATPGAPVEPWGSGNHCAMFRDGYLEVIGVTDPTIFSNARALVARYEGAHIVAFGVPSADAAYAALRERGIPAEAPRSLERDAVFGPDDSGTRRAAFRNINFERDAFPEARLLYIEHLTRDVLWQPHLLAHPNGVTGIRDILLCAPDTTPVVARLAALFGVQAQPTADGEFRMKLRRGSVWVCTPAAWTRWAPAAATPPLPCPVGIGFSVSDVGATRQWLTDRGVNAQPGPGGSIRVGPQDACGAALFFFQDGRP